VIFIRQNASQYNAVNTNSLRYSDCDWIDTIDVLLIECVKYT